jgi:two-component system OmpR family response regulator
MAPAASVRSNRTDSGPVAQEVSSPVNSKPDPGDTQPRIRALVVDDEASITDLIKTVLTYEGWDVRTADRGQAALTALRSFEPDVIVLDVMLPDLSGFEVLQRARREGYQTPVLFLTARDATEDRVHGLTMGGDDYVTKPFALDELVARLNALLRRAGITQGSRDPVLRVADLVLDDDARQAQRGGEPIELTKTEFELLRFLMANARRVMSKSQILDHVWNYDFGGQANIVELYIGYLRKKVDRGRSPLIHTVRGVGYVIRPPADDT